MKDLRKCTAAQIRDGMEQLACMIDDYQNEYEEHERELKRRGLKVTL